MGSNETNITKYQEPHEYQGRDERWSQTDDWTTETILCVTPSNTPNQKRILEYVTDISQSASLLENLKQDLHM
jgi:hypothetical protein